MTNIKINDTDFGEHTVNLISKIIAEIVVLILRSPFILANWVFKLVVFLAALRILGWL